MNTPILHLLAVAVVVSQEVSKRPPPPWWRSMLLYQVYPRSFQDSDGDGSGDLRGITERATYFKELGVNAVSLLPFYPSPGVDGGFDVKDHKGVDPLYGSMEDFDKLAAKLKELDIKLIVDFVPNHTSYEHPWFKKSLKGDPDYKDFYVWMDPKRGKNRARQPPNNWMSAFGGPAWEWSEEREQYYLHIFDKTMPDLNYRNPAVVGNMTEILEFWLDKGVDGIRMSAGAFLYKDEDLNLDAAPVPGTNGDSYSTQSHKHFQDLPETLALLRKWADLVYERVKRDNKDRVVLLEVNNSMIKDYFGTGQDNLELPFSFNLMWHVNQATKPAKYKQLIDEWMAMVPSGSVPTWVVGSHDRKRIADKYGPEMVDAINLLTGVLPGIKTTYYGEEIGMTNTFVPWERTMDPAGKMLGPQHYLDDEGSRDPERTPMQWNDSVSAGFSSNQTTWLPVNPNYWWLNVEAQRKADNSHLKVFQAMAKAREDPILRDGSVNVSVLKNDILVVKRSLLDNHILLVINMGMEPSDFHLLSSSDSETRVIVASTNSGLHNGQRLSQPSVELRPKAAILLKSVPVLPSSSSGFTVTKRCLPLALLSTLTLLAL